MLVLYGVIYWCLLSIKLLIIMLQPHRNLSQLPNFAFSVALAHFHSSKQEGEPKRADEMVSDSIIFSLKKKKESSSISLRPDPSYVKAQCPGLCHAITCNYIVIGMHQWSRLDFFRLRLLAYW